MRPWNFCRTYLFLVSKQFEDDTGFKRNMHWLPSLSSMSHCCLNQLPKIQDPISSMHVLAIEYCLWIFFQHASANKINGYLIDFNINSVIRVTLFTHTCILFISLILKSPTSFWVHVLLFSSDCGLRRKTEKWKEWVLKWITKVKIWIDWRQNIIFSSFL